MIAAIALVAVPNGLLADVLMTSRLLYGMARRGLAPSWLAKVTPGARVPLPATLFVGAATLLFSILLPFGQLVAATSALTLLIFLLVHISLWRLHARRLPHAGIRAPRWVPPVGAALCLGLLCAELASWIVKMLS